MMIALQEAREVDVCKEGRYIIWTPGRLVGLDEAKRGSYRKEVKYSKS